MIAAEQRTHELDHSDSDSGFRIDQMQVRRLRAYACRLLSPTFTLLCASLHARPAAANAASIGSPEPEANYFA
jgi:hypothetical protein